MDPTIQLDAPRAAKAQPVPPGVDEQEAKRDKVADAELEQEMAKAAAKPQETELAPWGFVVSVTRGGKHRKLHHIGDCRLVPGIHYKDFEVWGNVLPGGGDIDSRCGWCFPASSGSAQTAAEPESDRESVSSSSSSVGSAASSPQAKRAKA